jgi:hypothetical protein
VERERPAVVMRRYTAMGYESALRAYEADLGGMAESGYFPVGQSWGWDAETSTGFLVGGSSWKPGIGTLAVTYRLERTTAQP